ncbi:MAG: Eco57I restriction-modification methylase domain-containing protein [Synergistaceae bacterium]
MILSAKQLALREYYQEVFKEWETLDNNLQNVFTPYDLCEKMIDKVCKYCELKGKKILVTNLEFAIVLVERGIDPKDICFLTDCEQKAKFGQKIGVEIMSDDFFDFFEKVQEKKEVRTWDACIMNPPYQTKSNNKHKKTQAIWDKFVACSVDIVEQGGTIAAIHPSGWRNVDGMFKKTQDILKSKDMKYLEMHDEKDGLMVFGAETRYDWHVTQNVRNKGNTIIVGKNGESCTIDISKYEFIPNSMFKEINNLLAKDGEEKVEVLRDASDCHTQKPWMSQEKTKQFCNPCAYMVNSEDLCILWYSKKRDGHFGIPKLIWSNGRVTSVGSIVDADGIYGLTQFAYAIADSSKNLPMIKKAFDSDKFRTIMQQCAVGQLSINYKVIAQFRKDFWKEFV